MKNSVRFAHNSSIFPVAQVDRLPKLSATGAVGGLIGTPTDDCASSVISLGKPTDFDGVDDSLPAAKAGQQHM